MNLNGIWMAEQRGILRVCQLVLAISLASTLNQTGVAQSWPVHSPDVYKAVPQYSAGSDLPKPSSISTAPTNYFEADSAGQADNALPPEPITEVTTVATPEVAPACSCAVCRQQYVPAIDTRTPSNPCNSCSRPSATLPRFACNLPGFKGRPYVDKTPGGCLCGKEKPPKCPEFSVYWPRPFSAKLDELFPKKAAERYAPCQKKRCVDIFDSLATFKLINYHRTDNGYCGSGRFGWGLDPYGCLGEERFLSRIAGIDYRIPGQPVAPGNR